MAEEKFLSYNGKPIVRQGNTLYYGDPSASHILMLQILGTEPVKDLKVPTRVSMTLIATDPSLPLQERILKKTEKDGIYNALDVGMIWLDRALKK